MSGIWPKDLQCVAVLSFDIDATALWRRWDPNFVKLPSLLSMGEYGPSVAVPRILGLLDDYDLKATFFIPGFVAETHRDMVKEIARRGHEVNPHGYMHENPAELSREEELEILERGISIIEKATGKAPQGYRSPAAELSEHSLSLLAEHDFLYDSSLMGDDAPYFVEAGATRLVEIPIHWMLDDFPYFAFVPQARLHQTIASPDQVFAAWAAEFDGMYRYGRCFTLITHPQIIGRPGRLLMLERLIKHIRSHPRVAFMRCIEVAQHWLSR